MSNRPNDVVMQKSRAKRVGLWMLGSATFLFVLAALAIWIFAAKYAEPIMRGEITRALSQQFESYVTLGSFKVSVQHGFDVTGTDLRIQPKAIPGYPPVITVKSFRTHMSWRDVLRLSPHIGVAHVQGLEINLPPHEARTRILHKERHFRNTTIYIDRMECDDANLRILTNKPGKVPLDFQIRSLVLTGFSPHNPVHFTAQLINPKPIGDVSSFGTVGPWNTEHPRELPVSGHYSFQNANLGVFKGIAGILSSRGDFSGTLDNIQVNGNTDTPDFRLTHSNYPVDLKTQFHAVVDGTSGDTYLQPVHAQFLHSSLVAYGQIVRVPEVHGHRVTLNVKMDQARVEDLLQFAIKTEPPLVTGGIHLIAKFDLEPGKQSVVNRIILQGSFQTAKVHFTNPKTQEKIDDLSLRAQGRAKEAKLPDNPDVDSRMDGDIRLQKSVLTLQPIQYLAPGLKVVMQGTYSLDGRQFNLQGIALLDAKVSQTMTGMKSILLKPVGPFFHKNGAGSQIPIKVTGTQSSPKFGLNLKK